MITINDDVRRVVLTGGAGFIGSHLAEELLRRGAELTIVDNLDDFYAPDWKKANLEDVRRVGEFNFIRGDICDVEGMKVVIGTARPQAVIHLAARAGVRPSMEQPRLYERVNIFGTLNLLEISREQGVSRFIFGSSSSVYGASSQSPFSENHVEIRPISPYAATKLAGEMMCYTYAHLYRLHAVCLRFFTVYGPRQRPDLAIHKFLALLEAGKAIPFFGDGSSGRDYTYIDDIVKGVIAALEYKPNCVDGVPFEVFNLGNSRPVELSELVKKLERLTGHSAVLNRQPNQPGDVPLTWADIEKAGRILDYQPATQIEDGLNKFIAWYRSADPVRRA